MYHMTAPSHFGTAHPPTMFPGPLLPPGHHNQPLISYPTHSSVETPSTSMHQISPTILSQASPLYKSQQLSVYNKPYMGQHPETMQTSRISPHHHHSLIQPHANSQNQVQNFDGYPTVNHNPLANMPTTQQSRYITPEHQHFPNQRLPLSIDEELWDEINSLHLGYLETEDSPHKMEQREKLEHVIMEFLSITPHSDKFAFPEVLQVIEQSINAKTNFNAHEAACAFDALALYAANLISQPWRKEFREIKLHNGFWIHQVSSHLVGAEYILELMGYLCVSSKYRSAVSPLDGRAFKKIYQDYYSLQGVIDPDLISRLALDCLIAYCECQVLKKIYNGISEYDLTWSQILQFRQHYIGGVDITLRHLLFTLRQRASFSYAAISPEIALPTSPPPIPIRQSSSFTATSSSQHIQVSKVATTSVSHVSQSLGINKLDVGAKTKLLEENCASALKNSCQEYPDDFKNGSHVNGEDEAYPHISSGAVKKNSRFNDLTDGGHGGTCLSKSSVGQNTSRVPIAKLIDLDSSLENQPNHSRITSHHLLPKVLPHRTPVKQSTYALSTNHCSLPTKSEELSQSQPQAPIEAFQAGTLEEHLEASLTLVKNPKRNADLASKNPDRNSLETWDFVFRGLEKKGYNKDIGDRGDILHEISRQKNCSEANGTNHNNLSNVNLNLNNQKKDLTKNRPLTINQALQQFTLNETKDRSDRTPGSLGSHSASHAYVHENHKRNSLYDNVSGGFETAPQGSDDLDYRRLRKINNNMRFDNKSDSIINSDTGLLSHRVTNSSSNSNNRSMGKQDLDIPIPVLNPEKIVPYNANTEEVSINNDGKQWSCVTCTFLNKSDKAVCEMCGKSKDPGPDTKPLVSGGKQCPLCTLINDKDVDKCSACGAGLKGSSTYI